MYVEYSIHHQYMYVMFPYMQNTLFIDGIRILMAMCSTSAEPFGSVAMEDASFLLTVGCIYAAGVYVTGNPRLLEACKNRYELMLDGLASPVQHRIQASRLESVQAWATIVLAISEAYFLLLVLLRLAYPSRFVALSQDIQVGQCQET